ncbi:hypothetical protein CROQUDRAFT_61622 [Cronartium quercuum f. sp. fusiforme G11]|uniref:cellulase n=1 Tax=Cronartium quercuum f. sp. fusiforme G11 TaxID=708437 RepID=A0A9P6NPZ7_9BASI|nr:hypothetical protein CROQUDRAFT_61622 [Cronartium quercuum f. sp. fusiforme G11]
MQKRANEKSPLVGTTRNETSATHHGPKKLPRMNGVNMAGLEFGIWTNGEKNGNPSVQPPIDQIQHFVPEGVNLFRFPFGWQYLQPIIKGALDPTQLATLDKYVNATIEKRSFAVIDLHNYGRRDGKIVGQSDLGADALVDLWTKLALHYKNRRHVIFGVMNEPHDLESKSWISVVQQVVTAIRNAGAHNYILMPGNNWSHLKTFAEDYNGGMSSIKNPSGSTKGLIFEIHQYFDSDGSGTTKECNQDHLNELTSVVTLLKKDDRQALITEMGGGNTKSCADVITKFVTEVDKNYPTIAGSAIWSAGAISPDSPLIVTIKVGNTWQDQMNFNAVKAVRSSKKPAPQ